MTQKAFELVGVVEARTRDAENNLRRVDRVAQNTARSMGQSLGSTERGFLSSGRAASSFLERFGHISNIIQGLPQIGQLAGALTRPLFQAAEEGIRLNMTLEQAAIGYEQVAGSAQKADKFLRDLMQFAARSPFRFEGLLQASRLMTAMGFELNEQIPKLKVWGNAIASSGELSADKIHDVVVAFGQMRMAGRVNAQDMMQLTNANIPGWELLAKAIGKTVAETRKLGEQGRLNGTKAVEAITAMMDQDPRFKGTMQRLEGTLAGRLSSAEDKLQFAQAKATQSLTGDISATLEAALKKENLVDSLAGSINSAIAPVSGAIRASASSLLGEGLTGGISEGIAAGRQMVMDQVGNLGQGVIDTFANMLGIHSPSTVFIGFGHDAADGFNIGFAEGLNNGAFDSIIEKFLGRVEGRLGKTKSRSAENLARLMQREPGFKDKLIRGSAARGINPDHLLNVMAVETSGTFDPSIKNPNSSASGLIQFMADTARELGTTTAALRKMTATQQLDFVFKYFDRYFKGRDLSTQGALYSAVGTGNVGRNDSSVVMTSRSRGYAGNAATWDPNRDGIVRQGEMAAAAQNKLGAGVNFSINGSPISSSNPIPVQVVSAIEGVLNNVTNDVLARQKKKTTGPGGSGGDIAYSLGGRTVTIDLSETQRKKIDTTIAKMREGNQELTTSTTTLATSIVPKATQAFEQMAESTQQAFKAAGEYAKDVIVENEEAARRMKFDWNAVGAGFESSFQNLLPDIFTEGGKKAGLYFLQSFARSIGDEASRQLAAILSKSLFNFDGGSSQSDGGLFGNLVRGALSKIGIGKKTSSSGATISTQSAIDTAMQQLVEMNRGATRKRTVGGTMPATQNVGTDLSVSPGIIAQSVNNSADRIVSGQQVQTAQMSAAMSANTDRIVDAVTPRQQGFWSGLANTALNAAVGAAVGATVNGALSGGGNTKETGSGSAPASAPTLGTYQRPGTYNPNNPRTRPRTIGGRAFGGQATANQSYLIGEHGKPEILTMGNQPGWVTPIDKATSSGSVVHKHYHFNVHAHGADAAKSIEKSKGQIARQARNTLSQAA